MHSPPRSLPATWAPVALSRDVPAGSATDTMLHNVSIALWRGKDGHVHAWADRCPHRGMRLSLGFVRTNRLVCLYHGWEYESGGSCRRVPAHPDMDPPNTIRSTVYRTVERYGMVWLEHEPDSDTAAETVEDSITTPVCSVYVDSPPPRVLHALTSHAEQAEHAGNLVHARVGDTDLAIGIQPCSDMTTALHISTRSAEPIPAELHRIILWARVFRDSTSTGTEVAVR